MRNLQLLMLVLVIFGLELAQGQAVKPFGPLGEMDLEMTGAEYQGLLKIKRWPFSHKKNVLDPILKAGSRNLDWLKFINQNRDQDHQVSFTSASTQKAYPISQPTIYSPEIVSTSYQNLLAQMPQGMKDVLVGQGKFPTNPPVDDQEYAGWGRKMDSIYQTAARWTLLEPNLGYFTSLQANDLRGYYYLSNDPNINNELNAWNKLSDDTQKLFKTYLLQMCANNQLQYCSTSLNKAISSNQVLAYYQGLLPGSARLWQYYFKIAAKRNDVDWNERTNSMTVPFKNPNNDKIKSFLSDNIQDEWRWDQWHLFLGFLTGGNSSTPRVEFQAGVTPHVNTVGGNIITMDQNASLTEYDVQWTIRHEFGHVLGFVDCYLEFYDTGIKAMVSYQLDTTNLMCSRRGHLQEQHYLELKRAYGKF